MLFNQPLYIHPKSRTGKADMCLGQRLVGHTYSWRIIYRMSMERFTIRERTVELAVGDIVEQQTDAVVNAVNVGLTGGGGVDRAIRTFGGGAIVEEARRKCPDGCPTGSAIITGAGNLKTKFVIHAVGPAWEGGSHGEDQLLADAYRASLRLADEQQLESVSLPSLSTGGFRFPIDRAAAIALRTVVDHLRGETTLKLVRFVLTDEVIHRAYSRELELVAENSTQTS